MKEVEALPLRSAPQRVVGYLLRLLAEAGGPTLRLPAQKSLVASRLNVTPEHFSRILRGLSGAGLVRVKGRDIEVLDAARLSMASAKARPPAPVARNLQGP
jgi:CRP-like cAMP-binding protein